jgi:hypothetical protein
MVISSLVVAMSPAAAAGRFNDDDGSVHEGFIEAVAAEGITLGCNPPENSRFCPDAVVTRDQMAAFLVRALDLAAIDAAIDFDDDNGSVFERDIEKLATAGVTVGCNPPTNDHFCPDDVVTRGQMAAFLVRAFGYDDLGSGDLFGDDDTSEFETDIQRLATAGITVGCNPPANDRFCPDDPVTRAQMASFLGRALGLEPIDPTPAPVPPPDGDWVCTEVIGFSQTNQWYTGGEANPTPSPFEDIVPDDAWQLRWLEGAEARIIANPAWPAWQQAPISACTAGPVDRAILTVTGSRGDDVSGWQIDIRAAVDRIRIEIPTVEIILLQPVVGGPDGQVCSSGTERVRAEYQHPYIWEAIVDVALDEPDVFTGMAPRVDQCDDFRDGRGHLTEDASVRVGASVGEYYARED